MSWNIYGWFNLWNHLQFVGCSQAKKCFSTEHFQFIILYCFWNECKFLKDVAKSWDSFIEMRYHLFSVVFLVRWEWKMLESVWLNERARLTRHSIPQADLMVQGLASVHRTHEEYWLVFVSHNYSTKKSKSLFQNGWSVTPQ